MDNSARKDEIATLVADKHLHRYVPAFNIAGHHEREHRRLMGIILEALTSYEEERGEGWQQRIATIEDPRADDRADGHCFFCGAWYCFNNDGHLVCDGHKPDCLWQNAKDATPPASGGEGAT